MLSIKSISKSICLSKLEKLRSLLAIALFLCLITACENEANKKFTLSELENNKGNILGLKVEDKLDIKGLCDALLEEENKEKLEKRLGKNGLGLIEASYVFHILGIKYFEADDFEKGMLYQHLAADQYLNPLAMVLLARIYSERKETVVEKFPKGVVTDFEQDLSKSYHYLHWALNCAILTMEHFEDRYPTDQVNYHATPLINLFEGKDSTRLGSFDTAAAAKEMEAQLPEIKKEFEALYLQPVK